MRGIVVRLLVLVFGGIVVASCGSKSTGGKMCSTGSEGCACYGNGSCNTGLTCASNLCVNLNGGAGGATGAGGSSAGNGGMSGGNGGMSGGNGGMSGGNGGMSGGNGGMSGGNGGMSGGNGGASGCTCTGTMRCTTDGHCVDPNVIDDFADCNTAINMIDGRNGSWYASGDTGVNVSFAVGTPPSGFSDKQCGAWTTGGPTGSGTTNFGILGANMTTTDGAVSFAGHTGLQVSLEAQSLDLVLKTTNGGYFTYRLSSTSGAQTFMVPFSSFTARSDSQVPTLSLTSITDIQFAVIDASVGYGFVVHGVSLY
jgi:hypothetical protein